MSTSMGANSDPSSEGEALQLHVAKIREEIQVLEVAQALAKEEHRQAMFDSSDLDASGGLNKEELRACMKTHFSINLDEQSMAFIFEAFDSNKNGELEAHEFNCEAIMHALESRQHDEIQAWQQQQRQQEQEGKPQAAAATTEATQASSSSSKMWKDVLGEGNQDDNIFVRVGCVLAYVLPLSDGVKYGAPLLLAVPQLLSVALPFIEINLIAGELIPFGQLIWFLILNYLSSQPWVPSLLRFHLSQAVRLDVRISFLSLFLEFGPQIVGWFVPLQEESINQGLITEDPTRFSLVLKIAGLVIGVLAFMILTATVLYSVVCSLAGLVPERVPLLSKEVAGFLGLHRSSSNSDAN